MLIKQSPARLRPRLAVSARFPLTLASAVLVCASSSAQVSGPVQSARFVYEDGGVVELDGVSAVDVTRPSVLVLRVEFQSDLLSQETGTWSVEPFEFRWRFHDGENVLPMEWGPGAWIGARFAEPEWTLLSFDRDTGTGSVRLSVPLGIQVKGTELRFPLLPEAAARVELGLGWKGTLSVGEEGELLGSLHPFAVEVVTACPDVWIDPMSRSLPIMALHCIAVLSREALDTERTYLLHNPWPDMVRFDADLAGTGPLEVVLPPEEWLAIVPIRAIAPGPFSLELRDAAGATLASSGLLEGSYAFGATKSRVVAGPEGKVLPGAIVDDESVSQEEIYDPTDGPLNGGAPLHRRCYPASAPGGDTYVECSECEEASSTSATCASSTRPWTTARCPRTWLFYSCFTINQPLTTFEYEFEQSAPVSCSAGGWSVSGGVNIKWITFTVSIGSGVDGIKICCQYKKDGESGKTGGVKSCTG